MAEPRFSLTSAAFDEGQHIPSRHTCDADNVSPELRWERAPDEVRSYVLIMDDPDAPSGTFTHWVLFDIPSSLTALDEAARGVGIGGQNDFGNDDYGGPCPPPRHGDHRYFFKLYALDVESLNLTQGAKREAVESAMEGHVLAQAVAMGRYKR